MLYPDQFLGLTPCSLEKSEVVLIPIPMEKTVTYGAGTRHGPRAIIDASPQLEFFDEETHHNFEDGPLIHLAPPIQFEKDSSAQKMLQQIEDTTKSYRGKFLLGLGGEHLLTYGLVKGIAPNLNQLTIIHIDAHGDLIDEYEDTKWSHGTVMRRLFEEGCRFVQIGIRSVSKQEFDFIQTHDRIKTFYAHSLKEKWDEILATCHNLRGDIYLSIDVDGFDPSIIPSTGTPQPDGLTWNQGMQIIREVCNAPSCHFLGGDVVEFIPSPHPPGCDIVVSKLVAKILAYRSTRILSCSI